MDALTSSIKTIPELFSQWLDRLIAFSPNLAGALFILGVGWLAAKILKKLSIHLITLINNFFNRVIAIGIFSKFKFPQAFVDFSGKIVFWATLLFFATAAAQFVGFSFFANWLNRFIAYSPNLIAGAFIIFMGILVSTLAHDLAVGALGLSDTYSRLLGNFVQGLIILTSVIIGFDQMGIKVEILVILLAILVGMVMGSLALALSLGTLDLIKNLTGSYYLKQYYQPGQKVRFGNVEGTIMELTPIALVIATQDGRATVPARMFQTETSHLIIEN